MKNCIDDLAIFGGRPVFADKVHVGRPNIGSRERLLARINDMLDRRWLTNDGPFVVEFERAIANRVGVKHCIAVCNATIALELAIRALDLKDEVIVPSFTFIATAHALQWQQITPVFCDIDPATHTLDPRSLLQMITPRTTGIIGVHLWGEAHHIQEITRIAKQNNLRLMFDAAHAFACSSGGTMIGNFGDLEVFSFHATKYLNSFEGGAIVTNSDALAGKLRLMRNFGFAGYDRVIYLGTNGKLTEVAAAMGLTNLEALDEFVVVNIRNYETYRAQLDGIPGVHLREYDRTERRNFQYVVVEIDAVTTGIRRDDIIDLLHAENIVARRYFYPGCHAMEPYRSWQPHADLMLPHTVAVAGRVMVLPTGTAVTDRDINAICKVIRLAVAHGPEISSRLENQIPRKP